MIKLLGLLFGVLAAAAALGYVGGIATGTIFAGPSPAPLAQQLFTLQQLKDELDNDPQSVGYASMTNLEAANALNTVGLTGETVDVEFVSAQELQGAVVATEYLALIAPERELWQALLTGGSVEVIDQEIRDQVTTIWAVGTATRSNLAALQTRSASRAEALWGDGAVVSDKEVEEARLLP